MHRHWSKTASSATSSNSNSRCRTRRHAGAATRARIRVHLGYGWAADPGAEADRGHRAVLAANPALGATMGQAIPPHLGLDRPRPDLQFAVLQRAVPAGFRALATECALAARKVDFRKAILDADDGRRAHRSTRATAGAGAQEECFRERPWRPQGGAGGTESSAQELAAADHSRILARVNENGHPIGWPFRARRHRGVRIRRRSRRLGDAVRAGRHSSAMPPAPAGASPPGCRGR